jgi:transcriptional regulator with XRE-family HTH domain
MPTLGKFIQRRRAELGLTQEQLAEKVGPGVRQAEISRLEHDRITLPRRQRLEQIAIALDVPLGTLLARSGWAGAEDEFEASELLDTEGPEADLSLEESGEAAPLEDNGEGNGLGEGGDHRDGAKVVAFQSAMARAELQIRRSERAIQEAQSTYEALRVSFDTREKVSSKTPAPGQ